MREDWKKLKERLDEMVAAWDNLDSEALQTGVIVGVAVQIDRW
ncbi:hypothetical protein [Nitrosomonas sp. Is37]|nr:hypothetical protein [Nitrosomonas sp. Is37]MDV6345312.1 hypothetical protein [Nitrosomonas sp. Is37]